MVNLPVSSALIGRGGELSALLDAMRDPDTRTVLIAGEAGLGKSRLVGEFTRRLDRGTTVLSGRCPEFGTDGMAFAPFLAVLRGLLRELGVAELAALLPRHPALANWLPQLAVHTGAAASEPDRIRLFGEILTVLEQLAMTRPVLLILEDLHWADDASRELLTFLVANLADGELLLIGTYRPADAGALRGLITELRRNPGVRTLDLHPLTRYEVGRQLAALLGREPETALITKIFDRSGGNPLFVEALGQAPDQIPADLTDLLLSFQIGLTPPARTVLRLAAVIGSPIRHDLLAEAVDLPGEDEQPEVLHRALRELVDRGLLLTTDSGYEFRHALIRQATYDDMLPTERIQLHARLANILRDSPSQQGRAAELAHHSAAAGDLPQALTASWSAASTAAAPERLRQLERVLDLWDRVPTADRLLHTTKVAVLEQLTDSATASGAIERGIASAGAALALIDSTADPERAARLHRRRAALLGATGAGPGDDLTRALTLLPTEPPTLERAETLAQLALTSVFSGNIDTATEAATTALAIAEHHKDPQLIARTHAYLGLVASARPATEPSGVAALPEGTVTAQAREIVLRHFEAAQLAAGRAGDPRVLLDVVTWESAVLHAAGEYRAAISVVQQGLRVAHESFRFTEAAPILLVKWVQALTALGRWPEARAVVDDAQFEQLPQLSRAALLLSYGRIALAQGDTDSARAQAARAEELLGHGTWALAYRLQCHVLHGEIALALGDRASAVRAPAEVWSLGQAAMLTAHPHDSWPVVVLAARIGQDPEVEEIVALADSLSYTSPVDLAYRAVFSAWRSGGAADWEVAATAWRALEQPYELAESLVAAAECHAGEGDREACGIALREGAELAAGLGAEPLVGSAARLAERARISLDGSGGVEHKARGGSTSGGAELKARGGSASGSFGLTAREVEVLRLVAEGLSNRGLAGELFISANTAGVHVSRILTKLGVASRTEAAAFAHEHGLLG
ncbi:helix-turn-helix transcriptional regulator [Nocardia sp. SYP-A9097]|uniref:helix-turn-helix transcriptional regulator n=1 Tax=Nocardia sp. SYP-A9097 TaxID=2663237 RepID=UPI00189109BF|nr:helix-turn-helix transcriptional regulator [Nocardia sp. SYP-A9097]